MEFRCLYRIFVSFFRNQPEYDIAAVCTRRVEKTWAGNGNQHHFDWSNFNWRSISLFSSIETFKNNVAGYFIRLGALAARVFCFNPIFPDVRTVTELTSDTIITTICIYLLYGLFVGYSISFEYNELNSEKLARALGMHRE